MRIVLALFALLPATGFGARPFVTDDARLVEAGGCQIEAFVKRQREPRERELWFLPACNPRGPLELTLGGIRVDGDSPGDSRTLVMQGKALLKRLEANGSGFALTLGAARRRPLQGAAGTSLYLNGIASVSFLDDRVVVHANLGAVRDREINLSRATWGLGAEVRLVGPRLYGIVEQYGQSLEKPVLHTGLRFWIVPERLQLDASIGHSRASPPERRFQTIGLRILW